MPWPGGTWLNQIADWATRQELDQYYSLIVGWLSAQHKEDDSHSAVTADSVAIAGALTTLNATITHALAVSGAITNFASINEARGATDNITVAAHNATDAAVIRLTSLTTAIGGSTAPTASQLYLVVNATTNAITLNHEDSTNVPIAAWRFALPESRNMTIPVNGSFWLWYDLTTARWRVISARSDGQWTTPVHSDANYKGDGTDANWVVDSGDVLGLGYRLIGKSLLVTFTIVNTDVAGGPAELQIIIPGGYTAARRTDTTALARNAGAATEVLQVYVASGGTMINCVRSAGAWTNTPADNTNVFGQIEFEVQ